MRVRLGFRELITRFQPPHDLFACGEAIEAMIGQGRIELRRARYVAQKRFVAREIEMGLCVENVDERQLVPAPHLEVVEVVRGCDLDRAGALLRIGIFIGDDCNAPADQRQNGVLADELPVALVLGMYRNRHVAEHGLGTRGRHCDEGCGVVRIEARAFERIADVPQMPLHLDLLHFEVGNGGEEFRVPIDEPLVLVDEPAAIKLHEHLAHGARKSLVHGEALARPVAGGAEPLELRRDGAARLRLPRPHLLEEFFAPEHAPRRLLALHELALDHHLRGDAGVIGPGLPEHVAPAHPLEAGEHVLQRVVERMAHMQQAGDVGRRDDDAIRSGAAPLGAAAAERARLLPLGVDASLDRGRLVCLADHCCFVSQMPR